MKILAQAAYKKFNLFNIHCTKRKNEAWNILLIETEKFILFIHSFYMTTHL